MKKTPQSNKSTLFAANKSALARACNISRPTVRKFLKMPGAPTEVRGKGWEVSAVKTFISQHAGRGDLAAKLDPEYERLRAWEVFERCKRLHLQNSKDIAALMPRSHHNAIIAGMTRELHRVFNALAQKLAVEVVGLTVPEAEKRIRLAVNQGWETLRETRGDGDEQGGVTGEKGAQE